MLFIAVTTFLVLWILALPLWQEQDWQGGGGGAAAAGGGAAAAGGGGAAAGGGGAAAGGGGGIAGTTGTVTTYELQGPVTYTVSGVAILGPTTTVHVTSGVAASVWGKYSIALPLSMEPMFTMKVTVWGHLPGKTPWYKNPCIMGALGSGAANLGMDALGMIPGEKLASLIFKDEAMAAKFAKGIENGQAGITGAGFGNALADADWTGLGLGVAGLLPGPIGVAASSISIGHDGWTTFKAVKNCN